MSMALKWFSTAVFVLYTPPKNFQENISHRCETATRDLGSKG